MSSVGSKIVAVKGMPDILPMEVGGWQHLEAQIRMIMHMYAYQEIRMPLLERTNLFSRSIGEVTDIVEKEMYTFLDRNDDSITLRPEGTAGCVRACIEHSLLRNQQQQKLWYMGPMYRYERPQKGRYRQFTQLGVEAFNLPGPDVDAELLVMCARLWKLLKVDEHISLQINSIGDSTSRNKYREELVKYFSAHSNTLDEDSRKRLHTNPLRILDSKNPDMQELISNAPVLIDYIDDESKSHFVELQSMLVGLGIKYELNTRLVRGLDYYNRTVFEWVTDKLGAQSAVCAGGRYDNLVSILGGDRSDAVGFAIGLERLLLLVEALGIEHTNDVDGFLICVGEKATQKRLAIAEILRNKLPDWAIHTSMSSGNLGNLLKKADKSGAKVAFIIGDDEINNNTVTIKFLRDDIQQKIVGIDELQTILGVVNE